MTINLLTEHHLEFLSLKRGCTGLSESPLVKIHIVGNFMSQLYMKCCDGMETSLGPDKTAPLVVNLGLHNLTRGREFAPGLVPYFHGD